MDKANDTIELIPMNKKPNVSVGNSYNKVKKTIKKKAKRKARFIVVLILLVAVTITGIIIYSNTKQLELLTTAAAVLSTTIDDIETIDTEDRLITEDDIAYNKPGYGIYPKDQGLRLKQEMIEICNYAGELYDVPGKYILGLAMIETTVHEELPALSRSDGSLYKDLCIKYTTSWDGRNIFIPSDNVGKYKDSGGNTITDLIKVGKVDTTIGGAVGPFQFNSRYIEGAFTRMLIVENGRAEVRENNQLMSYYDTELGFMRPNPLYFPDAAVNAAAKIKQHMGEHTALVDNITNITSTAHNEILFFYAADAYHGDTSAFGTKAKEWHDNYGKMYSDIYKLKGISTLGAISENEYNRAKIRAVLGGIPFNTLDSSGSAHIDFDGTFNRDSSMLSTNDTGTYIELSGNKYYTSLVDSTSNTEPHNTDYMTLLREMPAVSGSGTNNKYSWLYGFEAVNTSHYFSREWENIISTAEKDYSGLPIDNGDGKVVVGAYPTADISTWIVFDTGKSVEEELHFLNNEFLGRLAKYAQDRGTKAVIVSGYRSPEDQKKSIDYQREVRKRKGTLVRWSYEEGVYAYSGEFRGEGTIVNYASGMNKSRHRLGIAVDLGNFTDATNRELEKYGLVKPMSYEAWHIEPKESRSN